MRRALRSEGGFSLIESLIALGILSVGMLSIAAGFLQGTVQLKGSDFDMLAREKAAEAVESVFTARDTQTVQWAQIRNVVGGTGGGVFLDGEKPLRRPGPDGLVNTADDPNQPTDVETLVKPGPDGLLGTDDDEEQPLTQFTREVIIRDVGFSLRRLQVIVRYNVGGQIRTYEITTFISSYA